MWIKICDLCGRQINVGDPGKLTDHNHLFRFDIFKIVKTAKNETACDICEDCEASFYSLARELYSENPYNPDRVNPIWHPQEVYDTKYDIEYDPKGGTHESD